MDLTKLRAVCKEIIKKTNVPAFKGDDGKRVSREFSEKELRRIGAHSELWWADLCEAFGVEE